MDYEIQGLSGYYWSIILSQFSIWPKGGSSFGARGNHIVVVKSQEVISEASSSKAFWIESQAQALNIEFWLRIDYVVNGTK